jgi:ZIP family zinc transporter
MLLVVNWLLAVTLPALVVLATLLGGAVPLRFHRLSRAFLGFSAGALVALALLELIPEALEADVDAHWGFRLVLAAFLATMLLDKLHILHPHDHGMSKCPDEEHVHAPLAMHGAVGLLLHSVVDGIALSAALRESVSTAVAVALALAAHKFADGLTTVSLVLAHHHRRAAAVRMLLGNAGLLAAGVVAGLQVPLSERHLAGLLLVMAGFFLYLGASDLIPSLTGPTCRKRDVVATASGMIAIALVSFLAH